MLTGFGLVPAVTPEAKPAANLVELLSATALFSGDESVLDTTLAIVFFIISPGVNGIPAVGASVGAAVGATVGAAVGDAVGAAVGDAVGAACPVGDVAGNYI